MVCRIRYLSSAGIHPREIPGIDVLARAFPPEWLFFTSLQCYPRNETPIEMDAMVVMDDRVLILEIKDFKGTLSHNGDQWVHNKRRFRSPVDLVSMKARKVKSFLSNAIPASSKYYVDSKVVLTGTANKSNLPDTERAHVWSLDEAASIADPNERKKLLLPRTLQIKKAYQLETDFDRVTRNAKMFGPLEADWDGYRIVDEDFVVHRGRIWREHRAEKIRDNRFKALVRIWAFDQLPPGLNSPERRAFVANRELAAIGRLHALGSRLVDNGSILLPITSDSDEVLTQHFELRGLAANMTTLDRYLERAGEDLRTEDRITATGALLNVLAELHHQDISHRDLGARSVWAATPTRIALAGLMASQFPDHESLEDWGSVLRGVADTAPEDVDGTLSSNGKQRDVYGLGRLAYRIITGSQPGVELDLSDSQLPSQLSNLSSWLRKSTSKVPTARYQNAQEMADEFAWLVEQSRSPPVDQTLLDQFETVDLPYVAWPPSATLKQSSRSHIYRSEGLHGEVVVKVWFGLRRGATAATDLAMVRLFDGFSRVLASPINGLPAYLQAGLSPVGPFIVYRHESGDLLETRQVLDSESALNLCASLVQCVDGIHAIGQSHGDISLRNILLRKDDGDLRLLDLFDMSEIGSGIVTTPEFCPENWEVLTQQQRDRYAAVMVIQRSLLLVPDGGLGGLLDVVKQELQRPVLESLEPVAAAIKDVRRASQKVDVPRVAISFLGGGANAFASDDGRYYLRAGRVTSRITEYSIAGLDAELTFTVVNGEPSDVRWSEASFTSLAHATVHGVPVSLAIDVSDGPDHGFEDLFAVIAPLIRPPSLDESSEDHPATQHPLDVRRYWRKMLELESASQPEVEILGDVGPSKGPLAAYAYERVGMDFDFDTGTSVEVRLPGGRKVGEVNLEQTDSKTLVVEYSDRRLAVGDRVNLVDRRARTSLDRRTRAVERVLDDEAAVDRLMDYFDPEVGVVASDFSLEVEDAVLDRYGLNDGQRVAFRNIARFGPVGLLQGPPGTGKTHFIASLVHWLVSDRGTRKILIASQSHEAVNNVIEALLDLYKRLGGERPSLLRIGSKGITDKIRPFHTVALQERFQARFENAFKHRVAGLSASVGVKRALANDVVELDRRLGTRVRLLGMVAAGINANATMIERRQTENAIAAAREAFSRAAAEALGRDSDATDAEAELEAAYQAILLKHTDASASDLRRVRHIVELSREWSESLASPHRNFEEFLAKTRRIVTATCVGVGQSKIRIDAKTYDWVIVDEAARCTPGELAVPIQVGRRILLVGDQRQLRPMIDRSVLKGLRDEMMDTPPAEFTRSDFERAFHSSYGQRNGQKLTEQYRMAPAICRLVSKIFYEPSGVRLDTSPRRKPDILFERLSGPLDRPITWVDTSAEPRHVEQASPWDKTSLWNPAEVEAIVSLLERMSEDEKLVSGLAAGVNAAPIGVICMYGAQKVKIEQAFSHHPWESRFRRLVRVDTVDSYQGKENAIVILSLVRCNHRREQGHVRSPNRCNVSLSRAKERLVIVGAKSMWSAVSPSSPMRRVLDEIHDLRDDAKTLLAAEVR